MNEKIDKDSPQQLSLAMDEKIVSRRSVLKSALTVGCGVLLPVVLIGCDSKQSEGSGNTNSSTPATPASTPTAAANPPTEPATTATAPNNSAQPAAPGTAANTPASTPGKVPQASVRYQDQPNGDQKCSGCALFVEPNACSVVEGVISPEGWCSIWAPKAA